MSIKIQWCTFVILLIIGSVSTVQSQNNYSLGSLPSLNVNKSWESGYALNFNWQSRQVYKQGEFNGASSSDYEFVLNDFTFIGSRSVGLNNTITAGYLLRFRDDKVIHRSIQQFILVKRYRTFRVAHRFATDQTFEDESDTEFRARYRLSSEIPLNGLSVDKNEFYIKINNEYLNSLEGNEYDLEIRIIPMLGRKLTDKSKVELGLDYRVNSFLETGSSHTFWAAINAYLKI